LKFITDPTPKRGPSNVQSVTEVFQLRQVVLLICKQTNKFFSSKNSNFFLKYLKYQNKKQENVKSILFLKPTFVFLSFSFFLI